MRSLAIVKPDHIGDLVLAAPVINWLRSRARTVALFVQRSNLALADALFPGLDVRPITLPHLQKGGDAENRSLAASLGPIAEHDISVFLRTDHVLSRDRIAHLVGQCVFTDSQIRRHETQNHRMGVRAYFGEFSSDTVWPGSRRPFPRKPRVVGLCIGSGFPSNKWSVIRWTELGRQLRRDGIEVRLIGGPQERSELGVLRDAIGLAPEHVIVGGADIRGFLEQVAATDVTIASDGGAGHLCSLVTPIISIAASVPFRRFAPFGAVTRVVSLDLPCSPCLNAHDTHVNMCFSHECSYGITTADVLAAMRADEAPPGTVAPLAGRARLHYGVSHAS